MGKSLLILGESAVNIFYLRNSYRVFLLFSIVLHSGSCYAGDLEKAGYSILNRYLKGTLISKGSECPVNLEKMHESWIDSINHQIDKDHSAIIITTNPCSGWGNLESQYLLIMSGNDGYVVEDLNIGDKVFAVTKMKTKGDLLVLEGMGWRENACHLCSDVKSRILYNWKTKKIVKNYVRH